MALGPPKDKRQKQTKKSHVGFYSVLAVLCAVVAVCGYFLFWLKEQSAVDERPRPKKATREEPKPVVRTSKDSPAANQSDATNSVPQARETWLGREVKEHRVLTNGTLVVETFVTTDGKVHKYYHDERENILPSAADQMLALITAPDDGFGAPPLPMVGNFENEFGDAIKKEIVIEESDSAEIKALKERVIAARKELLDLMAQGVKANDVVAEYKREQEDNATIRFDAAKGVRELLDAGDIDAAKELCAKYNEILERANIMPLEIPDEYLKQEEMP